MPELIPFNIFIPIFVSNSLTSSTCGGYRFDWGFWGRRDYSLFRKLSNYGRPPVCACVEKRGLLRLVSVFQGVQGTLFNAHTILFIGWGQIMSELLVCLCLWYWSSDGCIRRAGKWGWLWPKVRYEIDLWILLRGLIDFGSLFDLGYSRRRGLSFHGFHFDMASLLRWFLTFRGVNIWDLDMNWWIKQFWNLEMLCFEWRVRKENIQHVLR